MYGSLRVAIVDDHSLLREALEAALGAIEGIDIAVSAGSVSEFEHRAGQAEFDVVLADLELGDGTGKDIARITAELFDRPVLLMTGQGDRDGVQAAVDCGCAGFVSKAASVEALVDAIRIVGSGGAVFPASLLRTVLAPSGGREHGITDRELAVLRLLAQGKTAADIAADLIVSVHTARNHIRALLTKLQASSQLEAVVLAVRQGLVAIEEPSGSVCDKRG